MWSPISRKVNKIADDFLCSSSEFLVLSPFLYCGWFAPRRTFLLLWAPCILHALVSNAAGLLQGSLVLFDLHPHSLAPCIFTLGVDLHLPWVRIQRKLTGWGFEGSKGVYSGRKWSKSVYLEPKPPSPPDSLLLMRQALPAALPRS